MRVYACGGKCLFTTVCALRTLTSFKITTQLSLKRALSVARDWNKLKNIRLEKQVD